MVNYWDLDYSSERNFITCIENESHVVIPYNNISVKSEKILELYSAPHDKSDFREKYGYDYNLPVNRIIINHLKTLKSSIPIMAKTFQLPYIVHPDHHINMLKSDIIFIGYRMQGIMLDLKVLIDEEEYYLSDLLVNSTYDDRMLKFLIPYLNRGYYLPYILRCYEVMKERQRYVNLVTDKEKLHRFYYDESYSDDIKEGIVTDRYGVTIRLINI